MVEWLYHRNQFFPSLLQFWSTLHILHLYFTWLNTLPYNRICFHINEFSRCKRSHYLHSLSCQKTLSYVISIYRDSLRFWFSRKLRTSIYEQFSPLKFFVTICCLNSAFVAHIPTPNKFSLNSWIDFLLFNVFWLCSLITESFHPLLVDFSFFVRCYHIIFS